MAIVKLTTGWRVAVPIEIRRALGIGPKDRIKFTMLPHVRGVQLRPVPRTPTRVRKVHRPK